MDRLTNTQKVDILQMANYKWPQLLKIQLMNPEIYGDHWVKHQRLVPMPKEYEEVEEDLQANKEE
ncbi:2728_t:CDS:2 [Entrophospora sp. SA101]|nr:2728_t:CDS:2 [Entrophospora sp. SA101]